MTARGAQLLIAEVARTPASTPRPLAPPSPAAPATTPRPRVEQLLVTTCDVCRKPDCQREHRRRRTAAAASSRSATA